MPIFARRRLHSMLAELSSYTEAGKFNDLLARLENRDTNHALAAEAELSMLWAISRVAHLRIEPKLPGSSHRPDALSNDLFGSSRAVVEVKALSDDSFSGKEAMDRTANIIIGYVNQLSKKVGQHLHFEFFDRSYWATRFHRERCVDPNFVLTKSIRQQLREWIRGRACPTPDRIRITEGKTDVVVIWHKEEVKNADFRVFCRMPPVAYDLRDNPIYKALKKKSRQVSGAGKDILRVVFLVDAGCELLRRLRPIGAASGMEVTGEEVIWNAMQKLGLDIVCVFSSYREDQVRAILQPPRKSPSFWIANNFDLREDMPASEYRRLQKLAAQLPRPRFEGYLARSIHRQGGFRLPRRDLTPESGRTRDRTRRARARWLTTTVTTKGNLQMTIKISARLMQEYLAGHIDEDTFRGHAFGNGPNYFAEELVRGRTIQGVRFESGGIDEDDDHLVFNMEFDWAENPLNSIEKSLLP